MDAKVCSHRSGRSRPRVPAVVFSVYEQIWCVGTLVATAWMPAVVLNLAPL